MNIRSTCVLGIIYSSQGAGTLMASYPRRVWYRGQDTGFRPRSHYGARISDPDLSRYSRSGVASTIQDDLDHRVDSFQKALLDAVHSALESYKLVPQSMLDAQARQPKDLLKIESQESRIQELEREVKRHQTEKLTLNQDFEQEMKEKERLAQKLYVSDTKAKKLHDIILDSGLGSTGLNDEHIQKQFRKLRHDIFQLIKKYCTNRNASIKDHHYAPLDDEAKDFWVMSVIARGLYKSCFNDGVYFGFNPENDSYLNGLYNDMRELKSVSPEDLAEWRVSTCVIGKSWDSQGVQRQFRVNELTTIIANKLTPFIPSTRSQSFGKSAASRDVKTALLPICENALNLAILFSSSKTEYTWAQDEKADPSHIQVIGSAGYKSFSVCRGEYVVAFGGVLKGGGLHGRLADSPVQLLDTEVILGPFP